MGRVSKMREYIAQKWAVIVLVVLLAAVIAVGTGMTLAYLMVESDTAVNHIGSSHVSCEVMETFVSNVKSNVRAKNTGNTTVYIRMALVVTWQDSQGNVAATMPKRGIDYTVTLDEEYWREYGGYYYYIQPVTAGALTSVLVEELRPVEGKAPEGYTLVAQFLASAIQANPAQAIKDAWGIDVGASPIFRSEDDEIQ